MFRSPLETELLVRDRMDTLASAQAKAWPSSGIHTPLTGHPVLSRARHGLGRGLISVGERLADSKAQTAGSGGPIATQSPRVARTS